MTAKPRTTATITHLYRHLLREASYFPDPFVASYIRSKARRLFRSLPRSPEPVSSKPPRRIDPEDVLEDARRRTEWEERMDVKLSRASTMLRKLCAANRGEQLAVKRELEEAYARRGRRRWEILAVSVFASSSPSASRTRTVTLENVGLNTYFGHLSLTLPSSAFHMTQPILAPIGSPAPLDPTNPRTRPPSLSPLFSSLVTSSASHNSRPAARSSLQMPPNLPARADPRSEEALILGPLDRRREANLRWWWFSAEAGKIRVPLEIGVSGSDKVEEGEKGDQRGAGEEKAAGDRREEGEPGLSPSRPGPHRTGWEGARLLDELERKAGKGMAPPRRPWRIAMQWTPKGEGNMERATEATTEGGRERGAETFWDGLVRRQAYRRTPVPLRLIQDSDAGPSSSSSSSSSSASSTHVDDSSSPPALTNDKIRRLSARWWRRTYAKLLATVPVVVWEEGGAQPVGGTGNKRSSAHSNPPAGRATPPSTPSATSEMTTTTTPDRPVPKGRYKISLSAFSHTRKNIRPAHPRVQSAWGLSAEDEEWILRKRKGG